MFISSILSKDVFCRTMASLQYYSDVDDAIQGLIRSYRETPLKDSLPDYFQQISHECLVVRLLSVIMQDTEDISYFIYELDYGRKYTPGCVQCDGEDIDISTAERLYDYLMSKWNHAENNILSSREFSSMVTVLHQAIKLHAEIESLSLSWAVNAPNVFSFSPQIIHKDLVLMLLKHMFHDSDEAIKFFIEELECGQKYVSGCFVDNGRNIDLSSAEKLYAYLIKED